MRIDMITRVKTRLRWQEQRDKMTFSGNPEVNERVRSGLLDEVNVMNVTSMQKTSA